MALMTLSNKRKKPLLRNFDLYGVPLIEEIGEVTIWE
jgi:hypothetical protein